MELSSNYSIVKAVIAIFQVLYGSWELYAGRGSQFETYGYAAYSLTVVPFVAMSLLNLVATICEPQYSHTYFVKYNDAASMGVREELNNRMLGAVGYVDTHRESPSNYWTSTIYATYAFDASGILSTSRAIFKLLLAGIVAACAYLAPYVVAYKLTGYQPGGSGLLARGWITAWLVIGQVFGLIAINSSPLIFSLRLPFLIPSVLILGPLVSVPALGVFVFVAKMILEGGTCKEL